VTSEMDQTFYEAYYGFTGLKVVVLVLGLWIVFIWKRENAKPLFVKVIWILLCLG